MAVNLTQLFTAFSEAIQNAIIVNRAQNQQAEPFNTLSGLSYINPAWISQLTQSYDNLIRSESGGGGSWANTARIILQATIAEDNPSFGNSLGSALLYLLEQFQEQSATVQECTITTGLVADALNVGTPAIYISKTRYDGLIFQNTIAEIGAFVFTNDSYTGSATRNREPWQYTGAPNISSLGTGIPVGLWDWDWPQGSGVLVTGNNIDGAQEASTSGNYLTNGAFETWTGTSPAVLDNWYLSGGTWGTDIRRSEATAGIDGTYCVQFIAGTTTTEYLSQQFNSTETDGTDPTAGTSAALTAFKTYIFNVWLKAAGSISAGVLTISLRDSTGTVINDQAGTPNSATIPLASHSTNWTAHQVEFRLPTVLPLDGIVRLRIAMTTALAGADLLMDYVAFAQPTPLYAGGPTVISFANPADPVEAGPNPDGWTFTFTNNRGNAQFGWTWQNAINRLFRAPDLILPYSSSPTISDSLITFAITPNVFNLHYPAERTESFEGPTVDANTFPYTFQVIQHIGFNDATVNGWLQESSNGSSWSTIAGSEFTSVVASNNIQVKLITRTKRYIRYAADVLGDPVSAFIAVSGGY